MGKKEKKKEESRKELKTKAVTVVIITIIVAAFIYGMANLEIVRRAKRDFNKAEKYYRMGQYKAALDWYSAVPEFYMKPKTKYLKMAEEKIYEIGKIFETRKEYDLAREAYEFLLLRIADIEAPEEKWAGIAEKDLWTMAKTIDDADTPAKRSAYKRLGFINRELVRMLDKRSPGHPFIAEAKKHSANADAMLEAIEKNKIDMEEL